MTIEEIKQVLESTKKNLKAPCVSPVMDYRQGVIAGLDIALALISIRSGSALQTCVCGCNTFEETSSGSKKMKCMSCGRPAVYGEPNSGDAK